MVDKIKTWDARSTKTLAVEMVQALKAVADKYGVAIQPDGGRYDDLTFKFKVALRIADPAMVGRSEAQQFETYCGLYGLGPQDYKAKVQSKGGTWELVGFNATRPKYCLRMRNVETGKTMLYTRTLLPKILAARQPARAAA